MTDLDPMVIKTNKNGKPIMSHAGYLILQGGAEFGGQMRTSDLRAIQLAGGVQVPISIIPAAAAPDKNHERAGNRGRRWFRSLGAHDVSVTGLIDTDSANNLKISNQLRQSRLIYMLGGFPVYLANTLNNTKSWQSMISAHNNGAVIGGSSAGAMVLCEYFFDPSRTTVIQGLGLLPGCCILPHHDTFGRRWAHILQKDLPQATLIGIDEQTGMINDGSEGCWNVYGKGEVTVYRDHQLERYRNGSCFEI